jgi:hypothetical protein
MLMLLAALPVQQSRASNPYSEKLSIFIAGSSAYWYFTFTGVNGSSKLVQFEGSPGLSWYNVTAIMTTSWKSDFQIFGPKGYNLLPVPFIPPEGFFLSIGSDSYSDALVAAGRLDAYLLSAFVSLSNGTGSFEFYSPVSFTDIVPSTLLGLVPSSMGGFGATIATSSFDSSLSPFVILEGTKGSSGFSHSLVIGSISNEALDSQGRPNFLTYFGTSIKSLTAANQSSSSTIQVHVLNGLMSSTDKAVMVNDTAHFTSSYTLAVAPSKKVFRINATVLQQPLQLLATRSVDVGVLQKNQNMTMTISLTNLSNKTALDNVTFTDKWNRSLFRLTESSPTSLFRLVGNSLTFSLPILNASQSFTPTYVLQYVGNTTRPVTIPTETVQFAYKVGGSTFKGRSWLNPITILLGKDGPVLYTYVTPIGGVPQPVGATQSLHLVVKNVGTWPALSVVVDGQQEDTLLPQSTKTVLISQTANGLLGTNVTKAYLATYADKNGNDFNATTNLLPLEFTHSGMKLGFAMIVVGANLAPVKAGSKATNLTLSFTVTNTGSANISRFIAQARVPPGLGCGVMKGVGISCASDLLSLNYTLLATDSTKETSMKVNVTDPTNYFIPPLSFQGTTAGIDFTGSSSAIAVPAGFVLAKQFRPSLLFRGVDSTVTLSAVNVGPFYIYNASIGSAVDAFDTLSPLAIPSATSGSIAPGDNLSKSYVVTASTTYRNSSSSPITSSIFFGGTEFSMEGLGPYVSVYQSLNVTITTTPSVPMEGKDFNLAFTIRNPASVNVSSVLFTLPIPSGLTLSQLNNATVSKGVLTISIPSLLSHSVYNARGVGVASSGTTVPFDNANLTFVYEGVTIKGATPTQGIVIGENVTSRYLIPIAIAFVALLATVFYVRRLAVPTVPASPK